jgi:hypothetical protein
MITFFVSFAYETVDDRNSQFKYKTLSWNTNWNKHTIDYEELLSGGPKRDGIPPIDKPKFIKVNEAKKWIGDKEPVIFVKVNDKVKIYPIQVLMWHEIVNDTLDNKKISVTFCPLCNSAIVFNRVLNDIEYDFGTSGLLRNSDLVMYDRQTESLWQQFTGEGIVGEMVEKQLKFLPSSLIGFKEVYENYPNAQVLSKNTGYNRDYGRNPYSGYDDINQTPFLFRQESDSRLKPMQKVLTLSLNGVDKAYTYDALQKTKVYNDIKLGLVLFHKKGTNAALDRSQIRYSKDDGAYTVYSNTLDGKKLDFFYDKGKFIDRSTNSVWNIFGIAISGKLKGKELKPIIHADHFWFSWAVFKPKTLIHK